ncbi:MAG: hypothetical protein JO331_00715 [Verrucomicrobia bacterium]|nr:hypothetical protein [Verrucomicrobiota bacterium]
MPFQARIISKRRSSSWVGTGIRLRLRYRIADGDTIKVLTADKQEICARLAFIDVPEKGQAFGQRSKQAMSELVFGKDVKLLPHTIESLRASDRPDLC